MPCRPLPCLSCLYRVCLHCCACKVSGILSVVIAGLYMSLYGRPRISPSVQVRAHLSLVFTYTSKCMHNITYHDFFSLVFVSYLLISLFCFCCCCQTHEQASDRRCLLCWSQSLSFSWTGNVSPCTPSTTHLHTPHISRQPPPSLSHLSVHQSLPCFSSKHTCGNLSTTSGHLWGCTSPIPKPPPSTYTPPPVAHLSIFLVFYF